MRSRIVLLAAALTVALAACSAESVTAPALRAPDAAAQDGVGYLGGGGRSDG